MINTWRRFMRGNPVRKSAAFLLVSALWFTSLAFAPIGALGQTATVAKQDKKDKKDDSKASVSTPQTAPGPGKALSPNEDPAMIGKRNINGGTDKFFGWLGGSKEKEMQIGR